jgi:hypothetical protein
MPSSIWLPSRGQVGRCQTSGRRKSLKRFFHALGVGLKWLILALICVEVFSFLVITANNYLVFGQPWEGSPVNYDAYAIYER